LAYSDSALEAHHVNLTPANLNYPDKALSQLTSLKYLFMDGLVNRTFGAGFVRLTQLTHVDVNGKTGHCALTTLNMSTLTNLVALTSLNLTQCSIAIVTSDAFSSVPRLELLDLSYNMELGFDLLGNLTLGLTFTRLHTLIIYAIVPERSLGITLKVHQLRYFKDLTDLPTISNNTTFFV
jgi:hypothetical protein